MKSIALTGGIATGKSTFARALLEQVGEAVVIFDCDQSARGHLQNPLVASEVSTQLGLPLNDQGLVSREELRALVFEAPEKRRLLESIIHPLVRKDCLASRCAAAHRSDVECFIADIPLLFESDHDWSFDQIWVIACRPETQKIRLHARSGLESKMIEQIMEAQLPIATKVLRADRVIWNEGPVDCLRRQLANLIESELIK